MILLLLLLATTSGLCVYDHLGRGPMKGIDKWIQILFDEDHSGEAPIQPPSEWTNLTFSIPYDAYAVQLTANATQVVTEEVPFYAVDELFDILYASIVWWGSPWKLHVGWWLKHSNVTQ